MRVHATRSRSLQPSRSSGVRRSRREPNRLRRVSTGAADRVRIAGAEARRGGGVDELVERGASTRRGTRGCSRCAASGGSAARRRARRCARRSRSTDPQVVATARGGARRRGGARSTIREPRAIGDRSAADGGARRHAAARAPARRRRGDRGARPRRRSGDRQTGARRRARAAGATPTVAALALGRFGRRKIALARRRRARRSPRRAARIRARALRRDLRARARVREPTADDGAVEPRSSRASPTTIPRSARPRSPGSRGAAGRRQRRRASSTHSRDRDWRVAVEAVRALAGDTATIGGRDVVAAALRALASARDGDPRADAGRRSRRCACSPRTTPVAATSPRARSSRSARELPRDPLARGWIACLALAHRRARHRRRSAALASCASDLPDTLAPAARRRVVTRTPARVGAPRRARARCSRTPTRASRGAALGALAALWKDGDAADHRRVVGTLVAALASHDPIVAGAAARCRRDALRRARRRRDARVARCRGRRARGTRARSRASASAARS